ncbi:hypothetical protein [Actinoallomurus iriomotensis]|uniref:hypothetical protein n=1 Tax=Actinoallomurus iriomotensis TaxID=478107 RepID=UPI002555C6F0|nr:hypothetical protein [Actinoallomurus iriomotensis]
MRGRRVVAENAGVDLERVVCLYPLEYLDDGDEVTVGRLDVDSYAVLPKDGAELVRRLAEGMTPREAADWYSGAYGESVDVGDLLDTLDELGFIRSDARSATESLSGETRSVRWQRLGRALFSFPAWVCYGALTVGAVVAMARSPQLVPHYRNIFFTKSFTIVEVVLFFGQFPLLLIHEAFHALAGRRRGIRSRLSIGRRLIYIVFETSLDGLVMIPRRRRVLPIMAGMLADVVVLAVLTLSASVAIDDTGTPALFGRVCLALAYTTLLRLSWQFYFYLRTDLYVLFATALGCVDLHDVAKGVLRNAFRRSLGRPALDESSWHPTDRRVARWYAWLMLAGYLGTIVVFLVAVLPTAYHLFSGVLSRFFGGAATSGELLDSAVFVGLNLTQILLVVLLAGRDRRRKTTTHK